MKTLLIALALVSALSQASFAGQYAAELQGGPKIAASQANQKSDAPRLIEPSARQYAASSTGPKERGIRPSQRTPRRSPQADTIRESLSDASRDTRSGQYSALKAGPKC